MVLKKIIKPETDQFTELWSALNDFAHFTSRSQQIELDAYNKDNLYAISLNFSLHRMLLECNYHLINAFYINTSQIRHLVKTYGNQAIAKELKEKMNNLLRDSKEDMSLSSKRFIRSYIRTWKIKESV